MRSLVFTFTLAFTSVISMAGFLNLVEQHLLPQPVQAESEISKMPAYEQYTSERLPVETIPAATLPVAATRPKMRIGLFSSDEPVTISVAAESRVLAGAAHAKLGTIPANEEITLTYDRSTALYTVSSNSFSTTSGDYIKIKPTRANKVTTITSYTNPPDWDTAINDNTFYGAVELHYAATTDTIWVIRPVAI